VGKESEFQVLIAEDESHVAKLLLVNLQRVGYLVDTVKTTVDARSLLGEKDYDLVVCDLNISGYEDGLELLKEQRARSDVFWIMITNYASKDTIAMANQEGCDRWLRKPFSPLALVAVAKEVFEWKHGGAPRPQRENRTDLGK
jgi:DNA-binding response OmpR family regulator